jgi:tetratricopeptide (TPR) repeat protein
VLYSNTPHLEVAIALFNVGISCRAVSDLDNALLYLQESLKVYTELADSELSDNIADVLNQIGLIYFGRKDFQQGLVYFMRLLEVCKSRKDNEESFAQAKAIQNIGTSYLELKDFSKATPYLEEALDIYKKLFLHKFAIVDCISSIGYAYEPINDFSKSLSWYEKALEKCKSLCDFNGTSYKSGDFIEKIARFMGICITIRCNYLIPRRPRICTQAWENKKPHKWPVSAPTTSS